jgi:hypothetical protein
LKVIVLSTGKDPLREHELSRKLMKDGKPIEYLTFKGYIGKAESDDTIRLYLNKQFNEYIEIKKIEILHAEEISKEDLEFGGTCIWIEKNTEISKVKIDSRRTQAQFMEGEITRSQLKNELNLKIKQVDQGISLWSPICPSDDNPCTLGFDCQVFVTAGGPLCLTIGPPCPPPPHTPRCPPHTPRCPPTPRIICRSVDFACDTPDCPVAQEDLLNDPSVQLKSQLAKLKERIRKLEEERT